MHLEIVTATATAAAAAPGGSAAAAVTGDSLVIKNAQPGSKVLMLAAWAHLNTNGIGGQLTRPSGHDTTRGFRFVGKAATVGKSLISPLCPIDLKPQETMGVNLIGAATAGDVEALNMLIYYENLPGTTARLGTTALLDRIDDVLTVQASITGAAGPGYTGSELISADSDLLQANRDYVVLGATSVAQVHSGALTIVGPDTGNVRIGCPLTADEHYSANFFAILAAATGKPVIPIINSGNKGSTYLALSTNENGAALSVAVHLGLLK